jgi:hypothetical protein
VTFDELLDLVEPYSTSDVLEDLIKAKIMLDENSTENFTQDEKYKIGEISARLMGEIGDILEERRDDSFAIEEEDDDDLNTIRIPAGRKIGDPARKI